MVLNKSTISQNPIDIAYQNFQGTLYILAFINRIVPNIAREYIDDYKDDIILKFEAKDPIDTRDFLKVLRFFEESTMRSSLGSKNKDKLMIRVTGEASGKALRLLTMMANLDHHFPRFIREMCLTYLVSSFESLLSKILTAFYIYEPRALMTKKDEKNVNYELIFSSTDLSEIKEKIVKKEISNLLNKNIDQINRYLYQNHKIKLDGLSEWSDFREIFYRRNIVVHNEGNPDSDYRKKTGYKESTKPPIDEAYLEKSFDVFRIFSSFLFRSFYDEKYTHEVESDLQE